MKSPMQVGYWGQEIGFGHWHAARKGTRRPSALDGAEFARHRRLPLGQLPQPYLEAACVARNLFVAKAKEDANAGAASIHPNSRSATRCRVIPVR